jgi:tetratricopeptide (TPR) repeat protein/DNA-binding CsgD family transcriptional regulator
MAFFDHRNKELQKTNIPKYILLALFLLIIPLTSSLAITNRIDSLKIKILEKKGDDTASINLFYLLAGEFNISRRNQLDSALLYLNKALVLTEKTNYPKHLFIIYSRFTRVFSQSGNYTISLDYYFKMLRLLDNKIPISHDSISLLKEYASLYVEIGTCYFNMDNNLKALTYYRKSLENVKQISRLDKSYPANEKLVVVYGNIGSACLSSYNFAGAEFNFEKALELNKSLNNPEFDGSLYNNLGIIYKEKKDFARAFQYYQKSLEIRMFLKDTAAIAQTYNNIGDSYFLTGDYRTAIEVLNKALKMSIHTGSLRSQMKAANFLSLTYEKVGDYAQALHMNRLFNTLHDSIISNERVQNTLRLELQYQYEKQRKENEQQENILLAKKERKTLIYMTLSGVLLNRNQRIKMRQGKLLQERLELEGKNLTLEKQNLQMEKENLELELNFRNKELSTHVMYLLRKNEFISSIINKMLALKSEGGPVNNTWIQDILKEMQSNIDSTVWSEFEKRFQLVHQDFYQKLLVKFPDLTPNEIKICAFLKLNMTTKDISAITFQSIKSIQVARNRLRKKMGISHDTNLVSTIQQL